MANKNDALAKAGLRAADVSGFSGDTLDQLGMENIDGGSILPDVDVYCPSNSGNCVKGCACSGGGE